MKSRPRIVQAIARLQRAEAELIHELERLRSALLVLKAVPVQVSAVPKRRKMSAAGRAAISRAARKRWAQWRRENAR